MIFPDLNLLVYAYNLRSPQHQKALNWWTDCLNGSVGVGLAWVVIQGFVRITTHPKIFEHPLSIHDALGHVQEWLTLPHVQIVHPPQAHFHTWSSLLKDLNTAGNLTTDAHLAALAIDRGLILHTTDADFARFSGLKYQNPLAD